MKSTRLATDRLFLNVDLEEAELLRTRSAMIAVVSRPSPDGNGHNEDGAAVLVPNGGSLVLAVADGVGGHPGGAHASTVALEALQQAVQTRRPDQRLRSAIVTGFEKANEAVLALGVGGATTLAVAKIEDGHLRTFHVGDSAVALVGQRGRRKLATVPHSPVGYAVESGYLDEREAMHHEDRHFVSNVVGSDTMRIDVGPSHPIARRDTVVLATDGLLDNLFMDEIVERSRAGRLDLIAHELATTSRTRMKGDAQHPSKPDDLTFVLFRRAQ